MRFESIHVKKSVFLNKNIKFAYINMFSHYESGQPGKLTVTIVSLLKTFLKSLEILFLTIATSFLIPFGSDLHPLKVNLVFL